MTDAFMHQHRTLVDPQRFISGSICPSTPYERELSFASPSKRAADSQNFWRLSNLEARYICRTHFSAIVSSTSPSERAADSQTFWRPGRTRMPMRICTNRPFRLHFAGARARESKEALRTHWQCLASFRTFSVINLTSHN